MSMAMSVPSGSVVKSGESKTSTGRFVLQPLGPFSLQASIAFQERFTPAAYGGASDDHLHMAFVVDGNEEAVGVCVREHEGKLLCEMHGEVDAQAAYAQTMRILSLDVDGRAWPLVGQRDPVIRQLQARYPGLRPVCFFSPYEAAAWALIGHRIRIAQAAGIKVRMARELGQAVEIHGERMYAFPGPDRLRKLEAFPGLFGRKVEYLRQLALATLDGKLDAAYLRALPQEQALEHLKTLPGVGDFSAQLILLRGAGAPDGLAAHEPRLGRAIALAYGLKSPPTAEEMERIAEAWRPYRTWATLLLRVTLEAATHEIADE